MNKNASSCMLIAFAFVCLMTLVVQAADLSAVSVVTTKNTPDYVFKERVATDLSTLKDGVNAVVSLAGLSVTQTTFIATAAGTNDITNTVIYVSGLLTSWTTNGVAVVGD